MISSVITVEREEGESRRMSSATQRVEVQLNIIVLTVSSADTCGKEGTDKRNDLARKEEEDGGSKLVGRTQDEVLHVAIFLGALEATVLSTALLARVIEAWEPKWYEDEGHNEADDRQQHQPFGPEGDGEEVARHESKDENQDAGDHQENDAVGEGGMVRVGEQERKRRRNEPCSCREIGRTQ